MKFKALIDGVHFDPKKGNVKISLVATSHVSLDELTTLSPKEESIHVTLESEQAKIEVFNLIPAEEAGVPTDESIALEGERAAMRLKDAADRLKDGREDE